MSQNPHTFNPDIAETLRDSMEAVCAKTVRTITISEDDMAELYRQHIGSYSDSQWKSINEEIYSSRETSMQYCDESVKHFFDAAEKYPHAVIKTTRKLMDDPTEMRYQMMFHLNPHIVTVLYNKFGTKEDVVVWMSQPYAMFGGFTAAEVIARGDVELVEKAMLTIPVKDY